MVVSTKRIKKDFSGMLVGDSKSFYDTDYHVLLVAAKRFCKKNNLDWKFSCKTNSDCVVIKRIS